MMDKEEFFSKLYALQNDSDDEEVDTNDARKVLKESAQPLSASASTSASFPVTSQPSRFRRSQPSNMPKKMPTMQHAASAPLPSSAVRDTPTLPRKPSKLRHNQSSTPDVVQPSSSGETTGARSTLAPQRSASTPNPVFGPPLVFKHSTGIDSMLKKNTTGMEKKLTAAQKRKRDRDDKLVMKPESERIFAGKTFVFVPNDNNSAYRAARIKDVRERGGVWAREWTPEVTHIIVDKDLKLEQVMHMLRTLMNADSVPSHVIMVTEKYTIDCIYNHILVDEKQGRYVVESRHSSPEGQESQTSLPQPRQIKEPRSKEKFQETPEERTQHSERSAPELPPNEDSPPAASDQGRPVNNWRDKSAMLDDYHGMSAALDACIKEVQNVKDLPLSDDDDDEEEEEDNDSRELDDYHQYSSEEEHVPRKKKSNPKKIDKVEVFGGQDKSKFSCMRGGTGKEIENNPNSKTIRILERMADYKERIGDHWRIGAYRRAASRLKIQHVKIRTYEQAITLIHIGKRIAQKIEEIVHTGHLRQLDHAENEPEDLVLQTFLKIYGVGPHEASKLIQAGYKTLDDLRVKHVYEEVLKEGQRIGLTHYDDFNTRIPREEMDALGAIVKTAAKKIDPEVEAIIGGSYRRGAATSGDIDFLFTKAHTTSCQELLPFLRCLVDNLKRMGFWTADLAKPGNSRWDSGSKWQGACVLPTNPVWRRIDFLLAPETEIGAALIYFTGDDIFNRSIRLLASKMNMRLNQKGLYKDVIRGPKRKKLNEGTLVEGNDEREIFRILGVPWKTPENRICR